MRTRTRTIVTLALPIIGGMMSQNILNLVDTAMVGVLGDAALAAVGTGSFANFTCVALLMGLSAGVQAITARRFGEGRHDETAAALNGALIIALVGGGLLSITFMGLAPILFPLLNGDPEVYGQGVPYLQARLISAVALAMNFAFRGFWNGINEPKRYLQTLVLMHVLNIPLNYVLIFGKLGCPAMGATGAGLGSAIATWFGAVWYFVLGFRHARERGFLKRWCDRKTLVNVTKLSGANGLQQVLFAAGLLAFFWIIGKVGTAETAAASVLINVALVAILPGVGLGLAAASLVGQALGRHDPDDARQWGWDVARMAVIGLTCLGLPMVFVPDLLLRGFLHDPVTREIAAWPLRVLGLGIGIDGAGLVLLNAMLGAGAARIVMVVSVSFQWGLFLPVAFLVGPVLGFGLLGVWIVNIVYRGLLALVFIGLWKGGRWTNIKL